MRSIGSRPGSRAAPRLPACPTIVDVVGHLLANRCRVAKVFLDGGIFRLLREPPILGRLLFSDQRWYHHESLHPYWTRLPPDGPVTWRECRQILQSDCRICRGKHAAPNSKE